MSETQIQAILNKTSKDRFLMVLGLPPLLQSINTTDQRDRSGNTVNLDSLQFSVFGSVVPASYVPHQELRFGGQTVKVTSYSRPSYPNLNVGFVVDNGFRNYYVLYKWLNLLNDAKKSLFNTDLYESINKLPNKHEYMATFQIFAKNEYNKNICSFTYTNAMITRLEGISYDYKDEEQITSNFEFAFGQFNMELV